MVLKEPEKQKKINTSVSTANFTDLIKQNTNLLQKRWVFLQVLGHHVQPEQMAIDTWK